MSEQPPVPQPGYQPPVPQPGYQPPVPQPGYQPPAEYAPTTSQKKPGSAKKLLTAVIFGIVLLAAAVWVGWSLWSEARLLQVGNCLTATGEGAATKVHEAKCDDTATASWKIAIVKKDGTRCGDDFAEYYVADKWGKTIASYCLEPNLAANTCYANTADVKKIAVVACTDPNAEVKVTKVVEGTDGSACAPDDPITLESIKRTYCVTTPS